MALLNILHKYKKSLSLSAVLFLFLLGSTCDSKGEIHNQTTSSSETKGYNMPFENISSKLLAEDNRVSKVYKTSLPNFTQKYVLWRMIHDGSCWIQAVIIDFFYQMIVEEQNDAHYNQKADFLIKKIKTEYLQPNEKKELKAFLDEMLKRRDFAYFVSEFGKSKRGFLCKCFRALAVSYSAKEDELDPSAWGDPNDFFNFYSQLTLNFSQVKKFGNNPGHQINMYSYINYSGIFELLAMEYDDLTKNEINSYLNNPAELKKDTEAIFDYPITKAQKDSYKEPLDKTRIPKIIMFYSSDGHWDLAVRKSFADSLKKLKSN